jgi:uncharacterized protein (DUF1684 family)
MKFSVIISFIILVTFVSSCSSETTSGPENLKVSTYADSLNLWRKKNDKELKNESNTPLEQAKVESFTGLKYFAPNESWNIHTKYVKIDTGKVFNMPTTTERMIPMVKDGLIEFVRNGDSIKLYTYSYIEHPEEDLFVPFLDLTNGDITYGGGRYININRPINDSIWIDFNMAYNPYCAYNHAYSCPVPPLENSLNIEVKAGEKVLYTY